MSKQLSVRASEILKEFNGNPLTQGLLLELIGQDSTVTRIAAIEDCESGDLVFAEKKEYVDLLAKRQPSVIVTSQKNLPLFSEIKGSTFLISANVNLAHALIKKRYAGRDFDTEGWPRLHPSAVIHETAVVSKSAVIEPNAVIGQNVKIGDHTRVMAGTVVEHDAVIGHDCVIHPNVVIGYNCEIGNEVIIHSGSVIGSEGYGFAQDAKGKSHPIPQTGKVIIEDRVRVGAGCCIDRAAYHITKIGAGTKLDNLCHIAHNVIIGQDCLLTSMLCIAGSSKVGDRVITSGQTGILDHVNVCSDVVLLHRAGVTKDVEKPGMYGGTPLLPLSVYMKNTVLQRNIGDLRDRIVELEKAREPSV